MSEVAEQKIDTNDVSVIVREILEEETESLLIDNQNKEILKEIIDEKKDEIITKTFLQLVESYLTQDSCNLEKINIKLTPDVQKYFLLLCKESPDLFGSFEEGLKKIIQDNKINTKDIPDIIVLVSKVYAIINSKKGMPNIDPYELIKTLLNLALVIYIDTNKIQNPELLVELLKIVDSSIDLIKLTPLVPKKIGCLNRLFRRK